MGAGWTRWFRGGGDIGFESLDGVLGPWNPITMQGWSWRIVVAKPGAGFWSSAAKVYPPEPTPTNWAEFMDLQHSVDMARLKLLREHDDVLYFHMGVRPAQVDSVDPAYRRPNREELRWLDAGPEFDIKGDKVRVCVHCYRDGLTVWMVKGDEHCPRCGRDQMLPCQSVRHVGTIRNLEDLE